MSFFSTPFQHCTRIFVNAVRNRNKIYIEWERRNKAVFVCKLHNCLYRIPKSCQKNKKQKNHPLELRSDVPKLYTTRLIYENWPTSYILAMTQWCLELKTKKTFILVPIKVKYLRYKSNKIYKRSIWEKLQNSDKQKQRTK